MRHVVAIADVCNVDLAEVAEFLLQGEVVGERLARMFDVAERVDDRNARVLRHLDDSRVLVGAEHHGVNPALDVAGNIAHRFAFVEPRARLVHEKRRAAKAGHAGFKRQAGAQRGFLEKQHQLFAGQRAAEVRGAGFDHARQLEQRGDLLRREILNRDEIPARCPRLYRSAHSRIVVGLGFGSCGHHCFLFSAARESSAVFLANASSSWRMAWSTCCFWRMKGGKKRSTVSSVRLSTTPRSSICLKIVLARSADFNSMPSIRPSPRTSRMESCLNCNSCNRRRKYAPIFCTCLSSLCRSMVWSNCKATAQASGPPPKVVPCIPGCMHPDTFSLANSAPRGRPPAIGLATVTRSGWIP